MTAQKDEQLLDLNICQLLSKKLSLCYFTRNKFFTTKISIMEDTNYQVFYMLKPHDVVEYKEAV